MIKSCLRSLKNHHICLKTNIVKKMILYSTAVIDVYLKLIFQMT